MWSSITYIDNNVNNSLWSSIAYIDNNYNNSLWSSIAYIGSNFNFHIDRQLLVLTIIGMNNEI